MAEFTAAGNTTATRAGIAIRIMLNAGISASSFECQPDGQHNPGMLKSP
jgi:hypothetical protein